MRTIKFRGKRLDNGAWEYGDLLQYDDGAVCIGVHSKNYTDDGFNAGQYRHIVPVDENTVGQYTGLKDKNGEEICEGDVLTDKFESIGVVEWRNCGFVVNFGDVDIFLISDCFDDSYQMWAIGNMHDNPELLKGVE